MDVFISVVVALFIIVCITQVVALAMGFFDRLNSSYPSYDLERAAKDAIGFFWHMWLAGFTLGHKFVERHGGNYKKYRQEKRMEFARSRMELDD